MYELAALCYLLHSVQFRKADEEILNLFQAPLIERQAPTQLKSVALAVTKLMDCASFYPTMLHFLRTAEMKYEAHLDLDNAEWDEMHDNRVSSIAEHRCVGLASMMARVASIAICSPMVEIPLLQQDEGNIFSTVGPLLSLNRLDPRMKGVFFSATYWMARDTECPICLEPMQLYLSSKPGVEFSCKCQVHVHDKCCQEYVIATGRCFICHEPAHVCEKEEETPEEQRDDDSDSFEVMYIQVQ